jgi:NodT family efflux transporter outer membrane factor (OMF) lipoprotein
MRRGEAAAPGLIRGLRRAGAGAALTLVLGGVLAGCEFAPPYRVPESPAPAAFKEEGPWTEARPSDLAPKGEWWLAFNDPVLSDLEERVDTANPTLAAALAAYDQARALAAEARSALLPSVSGGDANTYNRQSDERPLRGGGQPNEYAVNTVAGSINYEFDFWGRLRNLAAAGGALAQASAADLATARLSLHVALAEDYLQLRGLDAQSTLLSNTVQAYERALALTQARHAGGVSSGLDVSRAQSQLSSAQAQVADIAARRALLEHAAASLVGRNASSFAIEPVQTVNILIPDPPPGVPSSLVQRRPDVAAAERRAFAANRQIGVARAAYFPQITLDAQYGWQNTGGNFLLSAPDTFWTLGPSLAFTLFDNGLRRAAVAASRAAFLLASATYRATVLTAFQQVEDQLALANHYAEEALQEAAAVRAAQTTTRLSLIRYREGATNYLDVVTAQTAELTSEETALSLQTARQEASVDLVRALGGGWSRAELPTLTRAASPSQNER